MIPLVVNCTAELVEICRRHHVRRLEVFGSAAVGDFDPENSDIDFLVNFGDAPMRLSRSSLRRCEIGLNDDRLKGTFAKVLMGTMRTEFLRDTPVCTTHLGVPTE